MDDETTKLVLEMLSVMQKAMDELASYVAEQFKRIENDMAETLAGIRAALDRIERGSQSGEEWKDR